MAHGGALNLKTQFRLHLLPGNRFFLLRLRIDECAAAVIGVEPILGRFQEPQVFQRNDSGERLPATPYDDALLTVGDAIERFREALARRTDVERAET